MLRSIIVIGTPGRTYKKLDRAKRAGSWTYLAKRGQCEWLLGEESIHLMANTSRQWQHHGSFFYACPPSVKNRGCHSTSKLSPSSDHRVDYHVSNPLLFNAWPKFSKDIHRLRLIGFTCETMQRNVTL